ncbi:MAG TPA: hypothetical protein VH054_07745 [Polyangiaceae bacterium]|nr:hypothetical protein [Polyangiaceae bacterium]
MRLAWSSLGLALAAGLAACLFPDLSALDTGDAGDAGSTDALADAPPLDAGVCDPTQPFTALAPVDALNGEGVASFRPTLTPDELQVWYAIQDSNQTFHMMHATRTDRSAPFGASAVELAIDSLDPVDPAISADGLTLVFSAIINNTAILYRATRASTTSAFGAGSSLVVGSANETAAFLAFDGSLWFSYDQTTNDIATSAAGAGGWVSTPIIVPALTSSANDDAVTITHDGLTAYVSSTRTDLTNQGGDDVFVAHRATTSGTFGALTNASELNSGAVERADWISTDNCRLYLESKRVAGVSRIYLATKSH